MESAPSPASASPLAAAPRGLVLLTGGTGYIGGRLIRPLEATGRPLRLLVRDPERLRPAHAPALFVPRVGENTEVVRGDTMDLDSLAAGLAGVDTACYLAHSLGASAGEFPEKEQVSARNFADAARAAGVRRIIYLGGLGSSEGDALPPHLQSRQDVGRWLRESGAEVIEFRASVIIGSGSLSFELVRALVDLWRPSSRRERWIPAKQAPRRRRRVIQSVCHP